MTSLNRMLNEGIALCRDGRHAEGLASFERVLEIDPGSVEGHNNRGIALFTLQRHAEAVASFQRALAIRPGYAEASGNLSQALDALNDLGVGLLDQQRYGEALENFNKVLEIAPGRPEALNNQGLALGGLSRYADALVSYEKALQLKPDFVDALNNRGNLLGRLRQFERALACYARAQAIDPARPEAHAAEGLLRLRMGDYRLGFRKYEWRWLQKGPGIARKKLDTGTLWTGNASVAGKSILLYYEQGLGDAILAARYVPLVAAKGARVVLEVPRQILPLVAGLAGVHQLIAHGEALPATDFNCPLLSLPLAFDTDLASIPAHIPYLSTDPAATARWRARLGAGGSPLVGICWRGNPAYKGDKERSIPFEELEPLLSVRGIRFISLQKELNDDEAALAAKTGLTHVGDDFSNTAEMISALDLVITVDSVWAQWAGAIGKPFWALLSYAPYWIWLTDREDSPWYPTARLFRQAEIGDWKGVVSRVEKALAKWLDTV